ncbi:hypothetical protein SISSUDRAFT_1040577 [Sistotremastrum suecicum HHB10207 ss-3]|uniref:Uncharacterized protein n=1 Tax=Sistotremastrum suecicum HHB10207 ss-3 TaxID=1314776 RepID=A0A166HVY2_9AGAM|nr:hypothetical protein SISSUDRAFT_1040577 [Sistotremastrum suecicum HHB10207 ss-3]
MDDLWGNAWTNDSEQPKPTAPTTSSGASSSPLNTLPQWNFQPSDALHDSEVDVGISSWNPLGGSGIKWEDDAEPDTVPSFTWKPTRTDTWSSHESETEPQAEAEAEPEFEDAEEVSKAASERTSSPPPILPTPPRSPIPDLPPARTSPPPSTEGTPTTTFTAPLAPPSPDPFGSFETGTPYDPHITSHSEEDDDDEKWPAAPRHFDDVDDVEVVWSAGTVHTDHTEVEEDEWTKAQEEQMMRDRRVVRSISSSHLSIPHDIRFLSLPMSLLPLWTTGRAWLMTWGFLP